MSDAPIPLDPNFQIQLPNFEGPLDLLLHLIKKHELEILDLPIAFVTTKYVEYLDLMKQLNLDVAAEYLVMAATLAHIKSKTLLPKPPPELMDEDDDDGLDPRHELIRRLLEYQKYKRASEELLQRGVAGRDVFQRGSESPKADGPADLAEFSVFKLIDAFQKIVKRRQGEVALEISAERISIQERITQIASSLEHGKTVRFETLFEGATSTYDLVVTFLAMLEMGKMRMMTISQESPDAPIHLTFTLLSSPNEDEGDDDAESEVDAGVSESGADLNDEDQRASESEAEAEYELAETENAEEGSFDE